MNPFVRCLSSPVKMGGFVPSSLTMSSSSSSWSAGGFGSLGGSGSW